MHFLFARLAPAVALSLPLLATAQQSAPAPAKALSYHSAFADYKPWQEIKPGNWRQLNDTLTAGAAGGHAGHGAAPSAAQPHPARPAPAASAPAPRHQGHPHHHHGAQQ